MPDPRPVPLEALRERTVQELARHFAADHVGEHELEARLDRAYRATDAAALRALVSDLPALAEEGAPAAASAPSYEVVADAPARGTVAALMGGVSRKGRWTPARELSVIAVMGGAELDFREARLGPGVTEVSILAIMGGVEIVVPPDLHVETHGFALLGGFEETGTGAGARPGAPTLRIGGLALMGGVEVKVRLPGETGRDARRRQRLERREARRLGRGG